MATAARWLGLVALLGAGACVVQDDDDDAGDSTLTISNESMYFLDEIHLAEVGSPTWGPDLLPGSLAPGDSATIYDIVCGTYDVLVVDETGVECELGDLELCFDDDQWVVDDFTLDVCAFKP